MFQRSLFVIAGLVIGSAAFSQQKNLALGKAVTANSENPLFPAKNVVDGKITRNSKWMSADVKPPHILEIDLQKYCNINQVIIYTGIPENERTKAESKQAAGFWSAKNFKLQYWDDANWTDIPNTEVHENRLTEVKFNFSPPLNTYKLRMVCDDGEPISIMEFQVFGTETNNPAPVINPASLEKKTVRIEDQAVSLKVENIQNGKTMKYVGYNQGYYMPGSNASGWLEYSEVNSLRIWTTLNSYVPLAAVQVDTNLTSVNEFDKRKAELRSQPENNKFLKWDILLPIYSDTEKKSNTNPMVLNYVLSELKRLKIDPVVQVGSTDFNNSWTNKWQQWQRYYALAYYMARTGDVTMFAMQNEPNHHNSGMKLDQWISGMQVVSDALTCAIEDVNKKYGTHLTARMVGPVTAGNNPEWWTAIVKAIRTDYHGKTIDHDLMQIFSTHSYNSPAAGYANRVNDIRKIITANHPQENSLPIVYTEIGRWMNAYLIDKEETMDSPSLFTEWAGIYTNNTLNHAYGMWAFKFSNTSSDIYSQGVKSGHHFTWQGQRIVEDTYKNLLAGKPVKTYNNSLAGMVTDRLKTNISTWKTDSAATEKWVEINLQTPQTLGSAIVYTGSDGGVYTAPDRISNFKLQYLSGNSWTDIPGADIKNNKYAQLFILFTKPVTTGKIRFVSSDPGVLKVREIKAFGDKDGPKKNQKNHDVSGIQRTGEVVRLFAKGFKEERPMFKTIADVKDENLDAITSFDPVSGNYYMWLVQRGTYKDNMEIDLSALSVPPGTPVSAEIVGPVNYGSVNGIYLTGNSKKINLTLPAQSVILLTIPSMPLSKQTIKASADATVAGGTLANQNYGSMERLNISLDASNPKNNQVSYIEFKIPETAPIKRAFLTITGSNSTDTSLFRFHVYAIPNTTIKEKTLNWTNAPQLDRKEALVTGVGTKAFVAGEVAFNHVEKDHRLDVTEILKDHPSAAVTFVLVRETRQMGDDTDKGKTVIIKSKESRNAPKLELWIR